MFTFESPATSKPSSSSSTNPESSPPRSAQPDSHRQACRVHNDRAARITASWARRSPKSCPLHHVRSLARAPVRDGGSPGATPNPSVQSHLAHQAFHAAAGHPDPFPVQMTPHLSGPIDPLVLFKDPGDVFS